MPTQEKKNERMGRQEKRSLHNQKREKRSIARAESVLLCEVGGGGKVQLGAGVRLLNFHFVVTIIIIVVIIKSCRKVSAKGLKAEEKICWGQGGQSRYCVFVLVLGIWLSLKRWLVWW